MSDGALLRAIEAGVYVTTPHISWYVPPKSFVIQLAIAEREMERRAIMQE